MRNYTFSEQQVSKAKQSFVWAGLKTDKRSYYKVEWTYWMYGKYPRKMIEEVVYDKQKEEFGCTCKFSSLYPELQACFHIKSVMNKIESERNLGVE